MLQEFVKALHENSINDLQNIPKSDLHNHAGRGGSIQYIGTWVE